MAGIIGGLVGAWLAKRASRRSDISTLLISEMDALYSEHPRRRQTARDIIRQLLWTGSLNQEQLYAANRALENWAAGKWELPEDERRTLEGGD